MGINVFPFVYQFIVYSSFVILYYIIDMSQHFAVPTNRSLSSNDLWFAMYFAMVTQSTAGFGDCYPTTWYARLVVMAHLTAVMASGFIAWC